jgi:hypothetical protein
VRGRRNRTSHKNARELVRFFWGRIFPTAWGLRLYFLRLRVRYTDPNPAQPAKRPLPPVEITPSLPSVAKPGGQA